MPVIVYKCTICNREIELQEKPKGLEVINQCIITDECRGTLYRTDRKQDFVVGNFPDNVAGLTNYIQRKVLYDHAQPIAESVWRIEHNLGVNPTIQVAVDRSEEIDGEIVFSLVEVEPQLVTLINKDIVEVTFDRPETGIAQAIARSSAPNREAQVVDTTTGVAVDGIQYVQVSTNGVITVAVDDNVVMAEGGSPPATYPVVDGVPVSSIPYPIFYLKNPDIQGGLFDVFIGQYEALYPPISTSPWNESSFVFVDGRILTVRSISYGDPIAELNVPNGTTVYVDQFRYASGTNSIWLFARDPYTNADKDRRRIFRPTWATGPLPDNDVLTYFIFANGEFFVHPDSVEEIFPPVYTIPS